MDRFSVRSAMPARWARPSSNHSAAAPRPRSSSTSGRKSLEILRVVATVESSSLFMEAACSARSARSWGIFALNSSTSILSAVRICPSSSCSSRAIRVRSASRTSSMPRESSRSSSFARRISSSALARCVMSCRITVSSFWPPMTTWEIDASIGNSVPSARNASSIDRTPMRLDVSPVRAKRSTCAR